MHHRGVHGLPVDPDLAYAYYANIAQQTTLDRQNPTPEQVCMTYYCYHIVVYMCVYSKSGPTL